MLGLFHLMFRGTESNSGLEKAWSRREGIEKDWLMGVKIWLKRMIEF